MTNTKATGFKAVNEDTIFVKSWHMMTAILSNKDEAIQVNTQVGWFDQ